MLALTTRGRWRMYRLYSAARLSEFVSSGFRVGKDPVMKFIGTLNITSSPRRLVLDSRRQRERKIRDKTTANPGPWRQRESQLAGFDFMASYKSLGWQVRTEGPGTSQVDLGNRNEAALASGIKGPF